MENTLSVKQIATTIYTDQKPGTSGLRKKVKVFQQDHYLANFVQSIFESIPNAEYEGKALVVSGDGRYYNDVAVQVCIQIALANGVRQVVVGQNELLSTPAVSALIRRLNADNGDGHCFGGIVLSASHNPAGPDDDFGIKFNGANGGPAPESVTEAIFENTKVLKEYGLVEGYSNIDTNIIADTKLQLAGSERIVSVIDNTANWIELQRTLFDFDQIQGLIDREDFTLTIDGMYGVGGPYAKALLGDIFGCKDLMRCDVLPDFGGGHPDPNLTYAKELVEKMGVRGADPSKTYPSFGAALDGDADRNMILGDKFFVSPSDSLAMIVANYKSIPYLAKGIKGAARSMPTSGALDHVCKKLDLELFETPTGWKFFGNLLDAGRAQICGEESFGTSSLHVREKDGLWAVLAWLQILAVRNLDKTAPLVTVEQIANEHWAVYGRNYYQRYDYENVDSDKAAKVFAHIESQFPVFEAEAEGNTATIFEYTDPIDGSISKNQGWIFKWADGSRFVFRKSGTGTQGATIRIYLEKFSTDISQDVTVALKSISDKALNLSQIHEITENSNPPNIT